MSSPEWPSAEPPAPAARAPALPRVEDLPAAEQGYDPEAVREAFDAFYRHAAQLDATLRTLEAVEVFQRTASELRAELRTVRAGGWTVGSYQRTGGGYARGGVREWSVSPATLRMAAEAAFIIVVGTIVGFAQWSPLAIIVVMSLTVAIVLLIEWVFAREAPVPRAAVAPPAPPKLDEPVEPPSAEPEAAGWTAFSEQREEGPEAMTMLTPEVATAEEAAEEQVEEPAAPDVVPEPIAVEVAAPAPVPPVEDAVVPEPSEPTEPERVDDAVAEVAEVDVEAVAEELEPTPVVEETSDLVAAVEPLAQEEPRRSRFRFWRRPRADEPAVGAGPEPTAEPEPEPAGAPEALVEPDPEPEPELAFEPEAVAEAERVDPWEQEPEVPLVEAESELDVLEPEAVAVVDDDPEPEPDEPEQYEGRGEEEDTGELPVEVLTDQAHAALERSRARRRMPRRARRR